jgi:undecaprenyl-diphosphatase
MPVFLAFILGLVQALTEFLPVSSSGHLVISQVYLAPYFEAEPVPLAFDVLVHVATLLATLFFLSADVTRLIKGVFVKNEEGDLCRRVISLVIFGSIPVVVVGGGFRDSLKILFESQEAAANGFLVTTAVLFLANYIYSRRQSEQESSGSDGEFFWKLPTFSQAFLIGVAQAIAIFPGVSRSGSTIAIALLLGLGATTAVRFSFLLSIPAIFGALVLEGRGLATLEASQLLPYGVGFLTAFATGLLAIRLLVVVTQRAYLGYFAIYTLMLGIALHLQ